MSASVIDSTRSQLTMQAASKWKNFTTDAVGNLTTVAEPDPSGVNVRICWSNTRADVVVVGQLLQEDALQLEGIKSSLAAVDHFASG